MEISKELQELITRDKQLFKELGNNAVAFNKLAQEEFRYLLGKKVKVLGNKGWNIGTITQLFPKVVRQREGDYYININVTGPDNTSLLFGLDEVELLEQ